MKTKHFFWILLGDGKTFHITANLTELRRLGKIALALVSSGIATTLLLNCFVAKQHTHSLRTL